MRALPAVGYQPRRRGALPLWQLSGHRLKPVWISAAGTPPGTALQAAAREAARTALAAAAVEGGSSGLGFAVLHEGADATWLLVHWWAHGDICCRHLCRAALGGTEFAALAERPLMACLWEMAVFEHERAAWIATMMGPQPDPEGYLARLVPEGWA